MNDQWMPPVQPGHTRRRVQELTGQALYWAACETYGVPACILDGQIHVEASPGNWLPFKADDLLRSLVVARREVVDIPGEVAGL